MAGRIRRAFTLIELMVVLAIIAMILALATPAVMGILKTTSIMAATDVLRSAVTTTRSSAITFRRSCSVDIRNSADGRTTDYVTTSAILSAEDFEPYDDDMAENVLELKEKWGFYPEEGTWEVCLQRTRELWAGRRMDGLVPSYVGNTYAWSLKSHTSDEPAVDIEGMVLARVRARRVTDPRFEWGFGLLTNFTRSSSSCFGYRFAVRVATTESGLNTTSIATLEKIHCPTNPASENFYEAQDTDTSDDQEAVRNLDLPDETISAAVTPGVWYWMKMNVKRVQKVVTVAGKIWVEGSPEPASWTVGPVHDVWERDSGEPEPDPLLRITDNFGPSEPLAGGYSGVWSCGAEVAADDFCVDWRNALLLPKGIHMQPKKHDPTAAPEVRDDYDLVALDRYAPGSFPLTYRPDGTAASDVPLLLVITNIASGDRRVVQVDRNTGRVEAADLTRIGN